MILGILTFLSALTISAVAIYYSVAGLAAIFAAAVIPIIIMGVSLEVGKLVTAVWLHRHWKQATWWLKTYLSVAVVVLMFITSMGIFGYLSKAHIEQTSAGEESIAQVERIESEIKRNEEIIVRAENQIKKLETTGTGNDANIQAQIDKEQERIDNAYKRIQPAIDEQQKIIDSQSVLWKNELVKIDKEIETLQTYIDNGETAKAQQMIGASADGIFGKKTADKIGDWQEKKQKERIELIAKIEQATNNPQAKAASEEIKRLRKTAEDQIKQSNALIDRLRKQLGNEDKLADVDEQVDEQYVKIKNANTKIDTLIEQKYSLEGEYRKLEAEVGPIKYIAEFIYGEQADQNLLEAAVRWVIIIIIFVFDPLAVLLLIASQYTFSWNRDSKGGGLPPKSDPDPEPDNTPPYTEEEWNEAHRMNYEIDRANKISQNIPPDFEEEKEKTTHEMLMEGFEEEQKQRELEEEESFLSKKNDNQYLIWKDIDPEPQKSVVNQETNLQKSVDPNQLEFDLEERLEGETEEDYIKRIWKKDHPGETINQQKRLKDEGQIDELPWDKVNTTIEEMKQEGEWPDQASKSSQERVSEQLEQIDDLEAWNNWVDKANEEAEKNPETTGKTQFTEVVEPKGFVQNEEQKNETVFNKINEARQNFDPNKIKELEITEEQYRDASQRQIISLIRRLKKGLINVNDLTESEADKITKLLDKR